MEQAQALLGWCARASPKHAMKVEKEALASGHLTQVRASCRGASARKYNLYCTSAN